MYATHTKKRSEKRFSTVLIISLLLSSFSGLAALMDMSMVSDGSVENLSSSNPEIDSSAHHSKLKMIANLSGVSTRNQVQGAGHNCIAKHNGTIFFSYTWFNNSVITLSVISSADQGSTWSKKVDIWSSTFHTDCLWHELLVWKGDIYAFINGHHTQHHFRADYMKKADADSWENLRTASTVTIRSVQGTNWKLAYDDDYIYMAMVQSSQWRSLFYRYDGNSWSSGTYMGSLGSSAFNSIEAIETPGGTRLVFSYCRNYVAGFSTGYIYVRTSSNQGSSWTSAKAVMNDYSNHHEHDLINMNGTLCLVSSHFDDDDVEITRSTDYGSTWSAEKVILKDKGYSDYFSYKHSVSLGRRDGGNTLCVAYEGAGDEINLIYSKDKGSTWLKEDDEILLKEGDAYDMILSREFEYMSVVIDNGSDANLQLFDLSGLVLDVFSPTNLTIDRSVLHMNLSWDPPGDRFFSKYNFENYTIYRGSDPDQLSLYKIIGNRTWFNDTITDVEDRTYYYAVASVFSELDESTWSNIVFGEVILPPPIDGLMAVGGDFQVSLSWNPPPVGITDNFQISHYTLHRGGYYDSLHPLFEIPFGTEQFIDTTVDRDPGIYHYKLTYHLIGYGDCPPSEPVSAVPNTLPGIPLFPIFSDRDGGVFIEWESPESDGGYDIDSYTVYRGHSKDDLAIHSQLMNPPSLDFTDVDLARGETYFYCLSASNILGEGSMTDPLKIEYLTVPSSPRELTAIPGDGDITLRWSSPSIDWGLEITGYTLYRSVGSGEMSLHFEFGSDIRSFTDPVTNGLEYSYSLTASNLFGEGIISDPVSAAASGKPGAVGEISVSSGDGRIDLEWEDVTDDGGSAILGFNVYRSLDGQEYDLLRKLPTGLLEFTHRDLTNGVRYYYGLSAYNRNGEGPVSDPVSAVPGRDPFSISTLSGTPLLHSSRIWWDHPHNGGDDILSYKVYRGESIYSLVEIDEIEADLSVSPVYIDNDLSHGSVYYYSISALNSWGESGLSPIIPVRPFGLPSVPDVYHVARDLTSFSVFWQPPVNDGGIPVTGYNVYYKESDLNDWTIVVSFTHSTRIDYLTPGGEYDIRVSAFSDLGEGDLSTVKMIRVGDVPDYVEDVTVSETDGEVVLEWSVPDDGGLDIIGYHIYLEDGGIPVPYSDTGPLKRSFTAGNLENGRRYSFRITAFNDEGEGPIGDRIDAVPLGLPSAVDDVWITEAYMGDVVIHWNPPADDGGSPVIGYRVYRGVKETEMEKVGEILDDSGFLADTALEDGVEYIYRISAITDAGEGLKGSPIKVTPLGVPTMVEDLSAIASTDSVELTWLPPADDHGSDVLGYYIYKGTSPVGMELWKNLDSSTLKVADEDVEAGKYHYRVVPYNSMGSGEESDIDAEVPDRIATSVMIGVGAFFIPLIIMFLAIILPAILKRSRKKKEEREAREAMERKEAPQPPPSMPPGPAPGQRPGLEPGRVNAPGGLPVHSQGAGGMHTPERQLPPMQSPPSPPAVPVVDDSYIRPEPRTPVPRDKDSFLRQNGMRPSDLVGLDGQTGPDPVLDQQQPPPQIRENPAEHFPQTESDRENPPLQTDQVHPHPPGEENP
jgi:hypothetical protein